MENYNYTDLEKRVMECVDKVINVKHEFGKNENDCLLLKVDPMIQINCDELDMAIEQNTGIETTTIGMDGPGFFWISIIDD